MKKVPLSELKDDFSRYLKEAQREEIVITRHGKPAGILVGFAREDNWFDYRLEHDPRFRARIDQARSSLRAGKRARLEDVDEGSDPHSSGYSILILVSPTSSGPTSNRARRSTLRQLPSRSARQPAPPQRSSSHDRTASGRAPVRSST